MARRHLTGIALTLGGIALFYWATLPPTSVVLDGSCRVADMRSRISEALYGDTFWRAQQAAVAAALQREAQLPAAIARAAQDSQMNRREERMSRLSNREEGEDSNAADQAAAQRERMQRMAWLALCQGVIIQRLHR